jgi:WD40 repeat protein
MITCVSVSPDRSALLVGSEDGSIGLWDLDGSPVRPPLLARQSVRSIAVSPDCTRIAAAAGQRVHVFDWLPRRPVRARGRSTSSRWDGHGDQVAPAIGAVGSDDAATGPNDRKDVILAVAFLGADEIVSAGTEQVVRIWGLDGAERHRYERDAGGITSVAATRHGLGVIATGGRDQQVRLRRKP